MRFGPIPVDEAAGSLLAHSMRLDGGRRLKKGHVIAADDIAAIRQTGIETITVATLEDGDIGEDEAAARLAAALAGGQIRAEAAATGRVNLYATENGLFCADRSAVDAINAIDPGITLATLDDLSEVNDGRMVATVKIIPYAVDAQSVRQAEGEADNPVLRIDSYKAFKVGVISTVLPALRESVIKKTERVLAGRLALSGSQIVATRRTGHDETEIAAAISELRDDTDIIIIFGASAISDADDVIPAAIRAQGGRIEHFGMPVDPGNLLLLGKIGEVPVIGAPGCARSPAENGFDWVLQRILAGRDVSAGEIAKMGVGGLLMEIGARPQPREETAAKAGAKKQIAAIVLAAGQSRRMGETNKLLARLGGKPLVAHAVEAASASRADAVFVVTGHESKAVRETLAGHAVKFVQNDRHEEGLSTSLAAGIAALGAKFDRAIILLGDMPGINADAIDQMIETGEKAGEASIVVATTNGKRGNPVIWPRRHFEALGNIGGDVGARHLIGENEAMVVTVELGAAAGFDIDTPQMLADAGGKPAAK